MNQPVVADSPRVRPMPWFLFALVGTLGLGWYFPGVVAPLAGSKVVQKGIVAAVLFATALSLDLAAMTRILRRPWGVLLACSINCLLVPLLAWPWARGIGGELGMGVMVASVVPSTVASAAVWTRRAGGNDAIPLMTTPLTNLLSVGVIPFWLWLTFGRAGFAIPIGPVVQDILILVVIPMLLAQAARGWTAIRGWIERHPGDLARFAQTGILAIVAVGGSECGRRLSDLDGAQASRGTQFAIPIIAVLAIHSLGWCCGYYGARWLGESRGDAIGVAYAGSQKTLMIGLHLAVSVIGGLAVLPMVAFHIGQLVIGTLLADQLRRVSVPGSPKPP